MHNFLRVLPETDGKGAQLAAEQIRKKVASQSITAEDFRFNITVNVGIASEIPPDGNSLEAMLHRADLALYHSKQNGRNLVTLFRGGQHDNPAIRPILKVD